MIRHPFHLAAALSLMLCAAAPVLWVRSHWRTDVVHDIAVPDRGRWDVRSSGGWVTAVESRERTDQSAYQTEWDRLEAEADRLRGESETRRRASFAGRNPLAEIEHHRALAEAITGDYQVTPDLPAQPVGNRRARAELQRARLKHQQAFERLLALPTPRGPYARHQIRHGWLAAAAGVLPAAWLLAAYIPVRARRRAVAQRRCPTCRYDLRATPHRCPECGAVPAGTSISS